jgi:thiamine pyrophosphokinase
MGTVVVLVGGPDLPVGAAPPPEAMVIAADGGADLARQLGLDIGLVVGDLDSVSPGVLAGIERVERHAAEKNATDLELALDAALRLEPERVLVLGGTGGRLDHLFAALLVLAADAYGGVVIDAQFGAAGVHVIRGERTLLGERGELISLFALHGPATGVVTEGLVYPLRDETLEPGSSRGVSNVFAAAQASIAVERGVVLAVRPTGSVRAGS